MSNILVDYRLTIDVPSRIVERLVGRPDDRSDEWYEEACEACERWVSENPDSLEYATNDPECEAI